MDVTLHLRGSALSALAVALALIATPASAETAASASASLMETSAAQQPRGERGANRRDGPRQGMRQESRAQRQEARRESRPPDIGAVRSEVNRSQPRAPRIDAPVRAPVRAPVAQAPVRPAPVRPAPVSRAERRGDNRAERASQRGDAMEDRRVYSREVGGSRAPVVRAPDVREARRAFPGSASTPDRTIDRGNRPNRPITPDPVRAAQRDGRFETRAGTRAEQRERQAERAYEGRDRIADRVDRSNRSVTPGPAQAARRGDRYDDRSGNRWNRGETAARGYRDGVRTERRRDRYEDQRIRRNAYRAGARDGYREGKFRRWDNRAWRADRRYGWHDYRRINRNVYHLGPYYAPFRGHYYNRVNIGIFLDSLFFQPRYFINDPWSYRLPDVYGPYRWVRYYDDVLLVDVYTGEVVDVIHDFFW